MQLDRQYRAVVALNNIGVSLLELGRHKQAHTTLVDAMLMLKPAFQALAEGPSSVSEHPNGMPDVDKLLLQANQRYARTIAKAGALPLDKARVLVVTSLADAADVKAAVGGGDSSVLHPIRLELNDHEVLRSNRSYDKEEVYITCFAIVHNCSIAHFLATDYEKAHEASKQKPFRMLEACHRILLGLRMFVSSQYSLRQQAYLDFIAHKTYMDMLRTTHRSNNEARLDAFHLERLRDGMDEAIRFDRMMNLSSSTSTLAPAA